MQYPLQAELGLVSRLVGGEYRRRKLKESAERITLCTALCLAIENRGERGRERTGLSLSRCAARARQEYEGKCVDEENAGEE